MPQNPTPPTEPQAIPPGFTLRATLKGHKGGIKGLAWTPDGRYLLSASGDRTVGVWELATGRLLRSLEGHSRKVWGVAVTPDGSTALSASGDRTVGVWELATGRLLRSLRGHSSVVWAVAVTPGGRTVVSASADRTVGVWELATGRLLRSLKGHSEVYAVAVTPDGSTALSASADRTVGVWELATGRWLRSLEGHSNRVFSVAVTPDGSTALSASSDGTVGVWELATGRRLRSLEGHSGEVYAVAVTPDGQWIASKAGDNTVRLWEMSSGRTAAVLAENHQEHSIGQQLAFHPTAPLLATLGGEDGRGIRLWELDYAVLHSAAGQASNVSYRNAKVVLVGDSGVGKSGLGLRLAGEPFIPTESTHGRRVWQFENREVELADGHPQTRETMLWDLAGQPGYRLVHQLNIDQAVVALVLVDARSETDPLGPAEYWARAIAQARSEVPIVKFLVEARNDRGTLAVSRDDMHRFVETHGFDGFFSTSALTGDGVEDVAAAIREAIPWDELPEISSTQLFTSIKQFLADEKARGDAVLLERLDALHARFAEAHPDTPAKIEEFRTCVSRLESAGLVEVLKFDSFGGESEASDCVLMQPEYVDAYASAITMTARNDPRGIGEVLESKVREGRVRLDAAERIADKEIEKLVLAVTIERLLARDIALRERLDDGDYLVFPSEYTRTAPYPRKNAPGISFEFEGPIRAIFTTLVVRLAHHKHFTHSDFYRDAARYTTQNSGHCIVVHDELQPGRGRLALYFENNPTASEQKAFLHFVDLHLQGRAAPETISVHRLFYCPVCGYAWPEEVINARLERGEPDIICPNCDTRSPLIDLLLLDNAAREDALQISADAESERSRQLASAAIAGKARLGHYDVFLSYNSADRADVVRIAESLQELGLRAWLDVWDLIPGRRWQEALEAAIENEKVRAAAIFVGPSGIGPWQNQEMRAFLEEFVRREAPVMPVLLPDLKKQPELPVFLRAFTWVDLRKWSDINPAPLANLVAGIIGQRPGDMRGESLAGKVAAAMQAAMRAESKTSGEPIEIVLPVDLQKLSEDELKALELQTAQLLGIPAHAIHFVGTKTGSVIVTFRLDNMDDASRFFAMVERRDAAAIEFLTEFQISIEKLQQRNEQVAQEVKDEVAKRQQSAPEKDEPVNLDSGKRDELRQWAGGDVATVAIVFTDIVNSTVLCNRLGDEPWRQILEKHFALANDFVKRNNGIFIKNTGDGVLAVFKNAGDALNFALSLCDQTGDDLVRVRVGAHKGQVMFTQGDAFGDHVNLTARVLNHGKRDDITVTDIVKQDIDSHRADAHAELHWAQFPNVTLKGFKEPYTLWRLDNP